MKKAIHHIFGFLDRIQKDHVGAYAAQSAYFILLSIIPFLLLLMTLVQYTPLTQTEVTRAILRIIPRDFQALTVSVVGEVYSRSLAMVPVTAVIALWSAGKGIQALTNGLNIIYQNRETRNYFIMRVRSVFYTFLLIISFLTSLVLLVFGNSIQKTLEKHIPVLARITATIIGMRTLITLVILAFVFLLVYKFIPNRKASFKSQMPGAIISSVVWSLFSFGFSVYLDYFPGFSNMYGSLTTIVLLMLWMYFCMFILLIGAEINAYFEDKLRRVHQMALDRFHEEYHQLRHREEFVEEDEKFLDR